MTMGERLRQAREEAGLSQRQVCGDQITRNQLSQLEHDRVGPSVETLRYLARQLGKPVSYFLGEISPNLQILQEVRTTQDPEQAPQLWRLLEACCRESGDYRGAYEYAAKLRPPGEP